jgi:competence protein ComEA
VPAPQTVAAEAVAATESPGARALREGRPLDLNAATAADLELLPDVGPALAARIVADRDARGGYGSVEEIDAVRGIGPRTLELLRPLVTVTPPR